METHHSQALGPKEAPKSHLLGVAQQAWDSDHMDRGTRPEPEQPSGT